uniref:LIM homeobox transcription factor 1, alpha n=1 Tax=Tetraodon nigroviridis TaxID=99883 RepID=H3CC20_TETNG
RLFAVRCGGCAEAISHTELVMRVGAAVFHLRCFTCSVCSCRLQTGDRCVLREGQLLCAREDYHRCLASPTSSYTEQTEQRVLKSSRASVLKAPRTILTKQQRRTFKASFEVSSKPCRKVRETLAAETGLSVRVVQVWFQNQRAKMKKLARTQEQSKLSSHVIAPPCGRVAAELECLGSSYTHPPQHQQQMGLTNLEQQDYDMDPFRQGLTPPQMPGDHMHPYGFSGLYPETDPLCHLTDSDCLPPGDPSLLTPIDRLYSMQDSYFTS